ncbi:MAG: hypothetical protein KCHDKBKB_02160 [Elusimicrobia bacterium]|nr:hypothetical protein [Elusimicrobiota bacterium]
MLAVMKTFRSHFSQITVGSTLLVSVLTLCIWARAHLTGVGGPAAINSPSIDIDVSAPSPAIVRFSASAEPADFISLFHSPATIYAHIDFGTTLKGEHLLEGRWITPQGRPQEYTRVPIQLGGLGGRAAYFWIRFNNEPTIGQGFSALESKDSANDFNGDWTLETSLDGRLINRSTFRVSGISPA